VILKSAPYLFQIELLFESPIVDINPEIAFYCNTRDKSKAFGATV
jgi:hypothetical protein